MAPRKRGVASANRGRNTARKNNSKDIVPDVYQDMLADAASSPTRLDSEGKTVKRRRIGGQVVDQCQSPPHNLDEASSGGAKSPSQTNDSAEMVRAQQTVYNDSEGSEESEETAFDWEEVDLKDGHEVEKPAENSTFNDQELNLVLGNDNAKSRRQLPSRRKPISTLERQLRLQVHKMHILCLLVHVHRRSHWCNDQKVQKTLRKLAPKQIVSYLNHDENDIQFQRSRSFMDGLNKARELFRDRFRTVARGMARSSWADSPEALAKLELPEDLDLPLQKEDFLEAAHKLEGSRDVGAQLFCALLRSIGVETRLVCSLQPLPFDSRAKPNTPQKPRPVMIIENPESRTVTSGEESGADLAGDTSAVAIGNPIRSGSAAQLGRSVSKNQVGSNSSGSSAKKPRKKSIKESPYPIYWVEAFNSAVQKWVPVDPLVTNTVAKPSKFEPPATDSENSMTYVVAFEDDGSARDVTRRYAKAYNAKTRKCRVESTKGGERWWKRVMKMYRREFDLDCDQVENTELAAKEAAEGMPKNVQDFKDHPYYALERHLKRGEVIYPKREVGKVAVGKAATSGTSKALEPIYRRRDVSMVKSADSWYRLGREVKVGEQPLKRVPARRRQDEAFNDEDDSQDEDNAGTGLYAAFQTTLYQAPPVVNGQIPKNAFGNLDIYTPTMVPNGGAHISHAETARAARLLGIDFADAVVGFEFKGRYGSAVIRGAVVASEYREAIAEVVRGFENERIEADEARRTLESLRMWKRFLVGLRIKERIEGYAIEGEHDMTSEKIEKLDQDSEEEAGGFLPDGDEKTAEPTVGAFAISPPMEYQGEGGFLAEQSEDDNQMHAQMNSGGQSRQSPSFEDHFSDSEHAGEAKQQEVLKLTGDNRIEQDEPPALIQRAKDIGSSADGRTTIEGGERFVNYGAGTKVSRFPGLASIFPPSLCHDLAPDELEDAKILQQLYESDDINYQDQPTQVEPANNRSISRDLRQEQGDNAVSPDVLDDLLHGEMGTLRTPKSPDHNSNATRNNEESEEDRGSLLSQDPSDEDADPEWIA